MICRGRESIGGSPDGETSAVEDVGVDHRRPHVVVTQELLNGADVIANLQQVRGKGVSQRVAGGTCRSALKTGQ